MSYIPADTIELIAISLPVGDSLTVDCPACGKRDKLSVTRKDGGILFHCYSASCGVAGRVGASGAYNPDVPRKPSFEPRYFDQETIRIPPVINESLKRKYDIDLRHMGTKLTVDKTRLVMPVNTPQEYCRGYVTKQIEKNDRYPKSVNYKEVDGPWLAWYTPNCKPMGLVIVEDQLSAMKLTAMDNGYWDAVALLGTSINDHEAMEIHAQGYSEVIVALDADATDNAYRLQEKYGLLWDNCHVQELERDIKDMSFAEIEGMFQ